MSGLSIVIPRNGTGPVTDPNDALLVPGSLVLHDYAHSTNPASGYVNATSGTPADGAIVNNVAWQRAATAIGSGSQATLASTFALKGAIANGTKGKFERSSKGAINGIVSQATALASGDGAAFNIAAAIRSYIAASGHTIYMSSWDVGTRADLGTGTGGSATVTTDAGSTTSGLLMLRNDTSGQTNNGWTAIPAGTAVLDGADVNPSSNAVAARFVCAAAHAFTLSAAPAVGYFGAMWGAPPSSFNNALLSSRNNKWPSFAHYRFYVEDLTVSGRTYAAVKAADQALWAAAFATGGRFAADTMPTAVGAVA